MEVTKPELGTLQSSLRLRRLQQSVFGGSDALDGLLLVAGIDGRYNLGSSQAISHLLRGSSNRDVADSCHLGTGGLSESVLLVKKASLTAYAPDAATADEIREMLAETCPDLQIYQPTAEEAADPDALEEHKMASFVQMLRGMRTLAIPYAAPAREAASAVAAPLADPMQLEQWPLLQSFGLEDVGRGGFFTQNFKVWGYCLDRARAGSACVSDGLWMDLDFCAAPQQALVSAVMG